MNVINLIIAFAPVAGLSAMIVGVLAASVRRPDPTQDAPVRLAVKAPRWPPMPANRLLPGLPMSSGPANICTCVSMAITKDLRA
jgi:hypothetical protein